MDLLLSDSGDLVIENGDLALAEDVQEKRQMIMCRVLTDAPDWFHHPYLGANLEDLQGEQMTDAVLRRGERQIVSALTFDGYFSLAAVKVQGIPSGMHSIDFFIYVVADTDQPVVFRRQVVLGR